MEEVLCEAENILLDVGRIEKKWKTSLKSVNERLQRFVSGKIKEKTPQKISKKIKKLSVITDEDYEPNSTDVSRASTISMASTISTVDKVEKSELPPKKDDVRINAEITSNGIVQANEQISYKTLESVQEEESIPIHPLIDKINNSCVANPIATQSTESKKETTSTVLEPVQSDVNQNKIIESSEKLEENLSGKRKSEDNNLSANSQDANDSRKDSLKKIDESLEIVPNSDAVVVLSDDETAKMPPPLAPPKKKKVKKVSLNLNNVRSTRSRIKQEKFSIDNTNNEKINTVAVAEPISTRATRLQIKKEKMSLDKITDTVIKKSDSDLSKNSSIVTSIENKKYQQDKDAHSNVSASSKDATTESGNSKTKKGKKAFNHRPIKEEPIEDIAETPIKSSEDKNKSEKQSSIISTTTNRKESIDSIYEDAVGDNVVSANTKPLFVMLKKLKNTPKLPTVPSASESETEHAKDDIAADATFISAKDVQIAADTTFTAACPQTTFVLEKEPESIPGDEAKGIEPADATFLLPTNDSNTHQNKQINQNCTYSSLMTEEGSDDDLMPPPVSQKTAIVKPKPKHEVFNPFIQSPVKKKVEAFEKAAHAAIFSPLQSRQTRTKTKALLTKENQEPETINSNTPKPITPHISAQINRLLTPTQQSNIPVTTGSNKASIKKLPNSASKLIPVAKPLMKPIIAPKSHSLSRENSVEDLKRSVNKMQLLAEEKKKKREMKQQQVAQTREAKEKERADKLKKIMQEREEKSRKKAQEMDQKRHMEEIYRNLKLQEEKREAQKRLEQQRKMEQEISDAARKERDMLENLRALKANQKQAELKKLAVDKNAAKYNFAMLNSDDSTDEEDKTSVKRPPPPSWSLNPHRTMLIERQSSLDTKVIDSFFSVQPMTPDLKEIFPKIDIRYLKRNSSMCWKTPPRYSQLPKY